MPWDSISTSTRREVFELRIFHIALISFVALSGNGFANSDYKPTRSECIVGYELDWGNVKKDRRDVVNSIAALQHTMRVDSLAGLRFTPSQVALYMIFWSDCGKKWEMSSSQLDVWRENGIELPEFKRIEGLILPSLDTIDVQGPYWRDGQPNKLPSTDEISPQET